MKLAYMVATPEVKGSYITAVKGDMREIFARIKDVGYDGIELMIKNPKEIDLLLLGKLMQKYDLEVPVICTGEIYGEDGLSFASENSEIRQEAVARTLGLMNIAKELGAKVNVGRLRGKASQAKSKEIAIKRIKESLKYLVEACPDIDLLIEPINREYADLILTTQEGVNFVKELNIPTVKIMLDMIHMVIEGENLKESINLAQGLFKHVHICDSERKPPGLGTFAFEDFLLDIESSGYQGFVGIEAFQIPDAEIAIDKSYATIAPLLKR